MNVIGEIGNFIIEYQEPLQACVIAALVITAVVIICKLFANAKKKREILSQINHTVSEIHENVEKIAGQSEGQKREIVYINNGSTNIEKELQAVEPDTEVQTETPSEVQAETLQEEEKTDIQEEKIEPSLKYFSRDCAVSKTGKQFTLEELNAQIKE